MKLERIKNSMIAGKDKMSKPFSEMSPEEVLVEFREAMKCKNTTTIDFILFWIEMDNKDYNCIKKEYPEYFL